MRPIAAAVVFSLVPVVAVGQPYAGSGGTSCGAFLAAKSYEGDPKQAEILEWVSGFASGINVGRKLSGKPPVSFKAVAEKEWIEMLTTNCQEDAVGTLSMATPLTQMPAFKEVIEGGEQ